MNKYTVGVDVGGTNIKLGLLNARGKILLRTRLTTKSFNRNKMKLINNRINTFNFMRFMF